MNEADFLALYFEDTAECLAEFEQALLQLEKGSDRRDAVDRAFRAMHTIKGNSGVFDFHDVVQFTHSFETMLDNVRGQASPHLSTSQMSALLAAVDQLQARLHYLRTGQGPDRPLVHLDSALATSPPPQPSHPSQRWSIQFRPLPNLLRTGNDPLGIFRALHEIGRLQVTCEVDQVPNFEDLILENCYLSWSLDFSGEASISQLYDLFDWVKDCAEIHISPWETLPSSPANEPEFSPGASASEPSLDFIKVRVDKIEYLINLVSELVVTQHALCRMDHQASLISTREHLIHLERHTRNLQESVLQVRMVPFGFALQKAHRVVRDACWETGKLANLQLQGEATEVDISILNRLADPIVHILRNAICHGVEAPEERKAQGKSEVAQIRLSAQPKSGNLCIEIEDDGQGINLERVRQRGLEMGLEVQGREPDSLLDLLFEPGFSTASQLTHLSGRGVGLDVVQENLRSVGGSVAIKTRAGEGTVFSLKVPLTLAILDGQICRHQDCNFAIPVLSILECLTFEPRSLVSHHQGLYRLRQEIIPIAGLADLLQLRSAGDPVSPGRLLVVVETEGGKMALRVDELHDQQRVVLKSLDRNYQRVEGVLGATLLGDGKVTLVLDVAGLRRLWSQHPGDAIHRGAA